MQKKDSQPKYFIKDRLYDQPGRDISAKTKEILERCDISRVHLSRWMNATIDSELNIKTNYLIIIADVLNCGVGDLINTAELKEKV